MKRNLLAATIAAGTIWASAAGAQGFVSTDRFGYTGTVTRYGSQADAIAHANGTTAVWPQRDLSLYFVNNNAAYAGAYPPVAAYFLNTWYGNGQNNPSNSNVGFIQLADDEGGTLTSQSESWANGARTVFQFSATGTNSLYGCPPAVPAGDCGRVWNGASSSSAVVFANYSIGFTATGLDAATWDNTLGVWRSQSNPTSLTGYMTGLAQNVSVSDPASNGWYTYDLQMNLDNYGYAHSFDDLAPSDFGALETAPEPASLVLFGTGLLSLLALRRRRHS